MAKPKPTPLPLPWPANGWEYLDLSIAYDGGWAEELNKLGAAGWYAMSVIHDESVAGDKEVRVILVRPREAKRAAPRQRVQRDDDDDDGEEPEIENDGGEA